jgi:hypothetical protein
MRNSRIPFLLAFVLLSGCAHQYVIKTSTGLQMTTVGKPKLKGSNYYYKDAAGNEHSISRGSVAEIEPVSMAQEEAKNNQFTPAKPPAKHWYWPF